MGSPDSLRSGQLNSRALASAYRALDSLAEWLIARAAPLHFGVARSTAEREAAYRLRYEVVLKEGWARADDLPDGLERDDYDAEAVLVVGWEDEALAGTSRVVFPEPGQRLPTRAAFEIVLDRGAQVVDWGRTAVCPVYRGSQLRVFGGLIGLSWRETRAHGFTEVCGDVSAGMLRVYRRLGLQLQRSVGPARPHRAEERYPVRFDLLGTVRLLDCRSGLGHAVPAAGSDAITD